MTHTEGSFDRTPLLDELRADTSVEVAALERVQKSVTSSLNAAHLAALGQRASLVPQPSLPGRWLRATWAGVAAALAVGTALGAGGHALVSSLVEVAPQRPLAHAPHASPAPVSQPTPTAAASAALVTEPQEAPPATAEETPPARAAAAAPSASAGLDAELLQLEAARSVLVQGRAGQALTLLATHARRYPSSMLAQERDALKVKALVAAGRHAEARLAGAAFESRYPRGLLLDAVKASLATIP